METLQLGLAFQLFDRCQEKARVVVSQMKATKCKELFRPRPQGWKNMPFSSSQLATSQPRSTKASPWVKLNSRCQLRDLRIRWTI